MFCNGIIIGAGVVGSAVAYELSRRGMKELHVFDPDLGGSLTATENGAGTFRQLWRQPVNVALARETFRLAEKLGDEVGFKKCGHLWLVDRSGADEGRAALAEARAQGLDYRELSVAEIRRRHPFVDKPGQLAFGVWGPEDGLLDGTRLRDWFREQAKSRGVTFHDRVWASRVSELHRSVWVETRRFEEMREATAALRDPAGYNREHVQPFLVEGNFLVLCAGAWTRELLAPLVPLSLPQPLRRQLARFRAEGLNLGDFGVLIDSTRAYLRSDGDALLGGAVAPKESPGYRLEYDSTFFESHVWPALFARSTQLERLKTSGGRAGVEATTPDGSGMLGRVGSLGGVFEAHGFAGHGVSASYGAAVATADLVLEKRFTAFDAAPLSSARFMPGNESSLIPERWLL